MAHGGVARSAVPLSVSLGSGSRPSESADYRADIDGLRGVAIALVCLFHAEVPPFTGGFVGVDVFFVISGFVITGVLLRDLERGRLSLKAFFIRRIRRLAPALALLLLTCIAVFSLIYPPGYLRDFGASLAAQSVFLSNIYFWRAATYFGTPAEAKPLLHTWSLSIEEQFYLIYATAFVLLGHLRRAVLLRVLAAAFCASLALSIVATLPEPNASFFLLPTRAWELLAGALASVWLDTHGPGAAARPLVANIAAACGLIAIVASAVLYSTATPFPYLYATLPVAGAVALVWSSRPSATAALLAAGPVVLVGKISYSLYLWHWVCLALLRWMTFGAPTGIERVAAVLAAVPIAGASWRFIESPIRQKRVLRSDRAIVLFAAAATAVTLLFGGLAWYSGGFPQRARAALAGFQPPVRSAREHECFDDSSRGTLRFCEIGSADARRISFIAIGDSHALSLLPALETLASQHHLRGLFGGTSGCPPFLGVAPSRDAASVARCRLLNARSLQMAQDLHVTQIILMGRWNYYTGIGPDGHFQAITSDTHPSGSVAASRAVFAEQLRATAQAYAQIGASVNVVLQVPQQRTAPEGFLYRRSLPAILGGQSGAAEGTLDLAQHRRDQHYDEQVFADTPQVRTFDVAPRLCPDSGTCLMFMNGRSLYYDTSHLSVLGASYVAPALEPLFTRIAGSAAAPAAEN
jgi:peptidoglycan/LPS O-acetylase OafA/YrhL